MPGFINIWYTRNDRRLLLFLNVMQSSGSENKVPVGVLEVKMELIPKTSETIGNEMVSLQSSMERAKKAERERLFLVYAKQWWKEYLQIRSSHNERLVKIFAQVRSYFCGYMLCILLVFVVMAGLR